MATRELKRCKWSAYALELNIPKNTSKDREGECYETPSYMMVKWKGNFGFTPYAKSFIEIIPNG